MLDLPPDVPPQYAPVMIAQTNQTQPSAVKPERAMGICHAIPNGPGSRPTLENTISPVLAAQSYFYQFEKWNVEGPGKVTILQGPRHGVLRLVTEADGDRFGEGKLDPASLLHVYLPESGYIGKDSATLLVEIGGLKVKVVYSFHAADASKLRYDWVNVFCGKKGYSWKIIHGPINPNSIPTSVSYQLQLADLNDRHNKPLEPTR